MNTVLEQVTLNNASLVEPSVIRYTDGQNMKYLNLNKEAIRFIYSRIGISHQVSKKLYQISKDIWKEVMTPRMTNTEMIQELSSYIYVIQKNSDRIVAILESSIKELLDTVHNVSEATNSICFVNGFGVLQMKFTTDIDDESKSLVLLDVDLYNGIYRAYDGVEKNDRLIISSPVVESYSLAEFLISLDIEQEIIMSVKLADKISEQYDANANMYLSVREVLNVLKLSGVNHDLDDDGFVVGFDDPTFTTSFIPDFLRSFDMPFKSLSRSSYLRKSLKYNNATVDDMLLLLSDTYSDKHNNVNANLIANLLKIYYSRESDKNVVEDEINK